jgi:GWxTD domain-containing protein
LKNKIFAVLLFLSLALPTALSAAKSPALPKQYATWMNEEVAYIITPQEKEAFAGLGTDRDRDLFIKEFWRQRDPTPGTPRNEYREEHERRIAVANAMFGRGKPTDGWNSERGRIYIKLGSPVDVHDFVSVRIYPVEVWTYAGLPGIGGVSTFRFLFFKRQGRGEFVLYDPIADGPKSLVPAAAMKSEIEELKKMLDEASPLAGDFPERWAAPDRQAYVFLRNFVSPELAEAALSFVPGAADSRHAGMFKSFLGDIESYPYRIVRGGYVSDFVKTRTAGDVNYALHRVGNQFKMIALQDASGLFSVHYALAPDALTFISSGDRYQADLKASVRLTDAAGKIAFERERRVTIDLKKEEMKILGGSACQLDDSCSARPGNYVFRLVLENAAAKEFTSIEKKIEIPDGQIPGMSPLLFAGKVFEEVSANPAGGAFQAGKRWIYPSLDRVFSKKDRLFLFFQIYGLSRELRDGGLLEYSFSDGRRMVQTLRKNVREYDNDLDFFEAFPLEKFPPGTYTATVALFDGGKKVLLSAQEEFSVAEKPVSGFWIVSPAKPAPDNLSFSFRPSNRFPVSGRTSGHRSE